MTDDQDFIDAICDTPEDDGPRHIYADYLDTRGNHERAEFVRVQIELANLALSPAEQSLSKEGLGRHAALRRREHKLLYPTVGVHDEYVGHRGGDGTHQKWFELPLLLGMKHKVTRGFISKVNLAMADFMQHAEAIFRRNPIEMVEISDRAPEEHTLPMEHDFFWVVHPYPNGIEDDDRRHFLPWDLWELLDGRKTSPSPRGRAARYETEKEANEALSRACVAFGRAKRKQGAR